MEMKLGLVAAVVCMLMVPMTLAASDAHDSAVWFQATAASTAGWSRDFTEANLVQEYYTDNVNWFNYRGGGWNYRVIRVGADVEKYLPAKDNPALRKKMGANDWLVCDPLVKTTTYKVQPGRKGTTADTTTTMGKCYPTATDDLYTLIADAKTARAEADKAKQEKAKADAMKKNSDEWTKAFRDVKLLWLAKNRMAYAESIMDEPNVDNLKVTRDPRRDELAQDIVDIAAGLIHGPKASEWDSYCVANAMGSIQRADGVAAKRKIARGIFDELLSAEYGNWYTLARDAKGALPVDSKGQYTGALAPLPASVKHTEVEFRRAAEAALVTRVSNGEIKGDAIEKELAKCGVANTTTAAASAAPAASATPAPFKLPDSLNAADRAACLKSGTTSDKMFVGYYGCWTTGTSLTVIGFSKIDTSGEDKRTFLIRSYGTDGKAAGTVETQVIAGATDFKALSGAKQVTFADASWDLGGTSWVKLSVK